MKIGRRSIVGALVIGAIVALVATRGPGTPVLVEIPQGATLPDIAELLAEHDVVRSADLFHVYVRVRRADRNLKAGTYRLETGSSMRSALRRLSRGEVETIALTVPEGLQIRQMIPRIAAVTSIPATEVESALSEDGLAGELDVPGPGLEGYLFPDTYRFARGVPIRAVVETMVARYGEVWTPQRRARLEESGMTEREAVTLASIIQAEARHVGEMPRISGVYHNRLDRGWMLQADPTVIYALGGYRERLLFAAIDSVQDNPYNTYANRGLPPGPIGSPGELAIEAALFPEEHDYMYFVAWPDGTHVFTQSLAEHNAAKEKARRARQGA